MAIYNNRICRTCGVKFSGGPRAWYCPECRTVRAKERKHKYKQVGFERHVGDIDICKCCGKQYIISSGPQRFCTDCAKINLKELDRKQGLDYYYQNKDKINPIRNQKRIEERKARQMKYDQRNFAISEAVNYSNVDAFLSDMVNSVKFENEWISETEFNPDTLTALKEIYWFANTSIHDIRQKYKIGRAEFCRMFNIPYRTVENWESDTDDHHKMPIYLKMAIYQILSKKDLL